MVKDNMQQINEQSEQKYDIIFGILNDFVNENFHIDENYEMTEEDAYITSIIVDYFQENFKFPTLEESVVESVTGVNINHNLYYDLADVLMDESIGTFVAGAAHGISNYLAKRKFNSSDRKLQNAKPEPDDIQYYDKHSLRSGRKVLAHKELARHISNKQYSGLSGIYNKYKDQKELNRSKEYYNKVRANVKNATAKQKNAKQKLNDVETRRNNLATKIDTGINNIKNVVKHPIKTAASTLSKIFN